MSQGTLDRIDQLVCESTPLGRLGGEGDLMGAILAFTQYPPGQIRPA